MIYLKEVDPVWEFYSDEEKAKIAKQIQLMKDKEAKTRYFSTKTSKTNF